jgi:hypothetical protein
MRAARARNPIAYTEPVVVVRQGGELMTGVNTVGWFSASFSVSDGRLSCSGQYNPFITSKMIKIGTACSDGRRGLVTAERESTGTSGSGMVELDDGTRAAFFFGPSAIARASTLSAKIRIATTPATKSEAEIDSAQATVVRSVPKPSAKDACGMIQQRDGSVLLRPC